MAFNSSSHEVAERVERRWAFVVLGIVVIFLMAIVVYTGLHWAMMPPSRVETIRPETLHVSGEFVESNLGSTIEADVAVTVRIVVQQYSFTPQCLVVPVTFRATSSRMWCMAFSSPIPIYQLDARTRLHLDLQDHVQGTGRSHHSVPRILRHRHQNMWAHVKVIDRNEFMQMAEKLPADSRRLSCVH